MLRCVQSWVDKLEVDNIRRGEGNTNDHTTNCAFLVHAFGEDTHDNRREERTRRKTEGEGDNLCHESGWIYTEIPSNTDRYTRCNTCGTQFLFLL